MATHPGRPPARTPAAAQEPSYEAAGASRTARASASPTPVPSDTPYLHGIKRQGSRLLPLLRG
ncbi:hypothetical protein [Actinoplanes sp. NPDC049118]|uniref:hypothetical protein n=1 Tax=Actinoplanes sp. NPDC049118 TaxID=3155769 RepID=UPI0033DD696E